jgi:hypothetical protein
MDGAYSIFIVASFFRYTFFNVFPYQSSDFV